ncbi:FAD-dependent oxidoreductase [Desulfofundulus thermobenzoicus]|uniref:L-aspartate oxidase n=1 Tax=Desulfofundulus thermobenzoicus TaxID=29376 RepID=A0A6N7IUB1_9FIRM|nr:FAD-dependent oxidoreductase [Desulfofundulus thermobenzoicus]MQL53143.1 FAD-dependent oxidoreductase [Desulfofundulus thermobenzoicus]
MEKLTCDVLVVGGGLAGLMAAIEARMYVEKVALASNAPVGRGGNTMVSGAGFAAYLGEEMPEDSRQQFLQDTWNGGRQIGDLRLIETLVDKAGPALLQMEAGNGVKLQRVEGKVVRRRPPGHTFARQVSTVFSGYPYKTRGLSITLPLARSALNLGILGLDHCPAMELAVHDGRVCGAYLLDGRGKRLIGVNAGAVVLAAGGGGRLFAHTNNTRDVGGEAFALALKAGAELRDMEFVQFYPTMGVKPVKVTISNSLFGHGAVLRNGSGERFMERYDPRGDMATRDMMSRAIFQEVEQGKGIHGGVYLDCTGIGEDILLNVYRDLTLFLRKHGCDPARDWLVVYPSTHFFCGGVKIDARGYTGVPGLFAAGEAAGGLHGANRLAGNALSEALVFGRCAGEAAGKYAAGLKGVLPPLPEPPLFSFRREGSVSLEEVVSTLRKTLWENAALVRDRQSLEKARDTIAVCESALETCRVSDELEMGYIYRAKNMCLVGRAVVEAALLREESRGNHYRKDFPRENEAYRGSFLIRLVGRELVLEFRTR